MNQTHLVQQLERAYAVGSKPVTHLQIGCDYDVDVRIQEGDKLRVQTYRGTLIRHHRAGLKSTMTLRKLSRGVGVERIFPVGSPDVVAVRPVPDARKRQPAFKRRSGR